MDNNTFDPLKNNPELAMPEGGGVTLANPGETDQQVQKQVNANSLETQVENKGVIEGAFDWFAKGSVTAVNAETSAAAVLLAKAKQEYQEAKVSERVDPAFRKKLTREYIQSALPATVPFEEAITLEDAPNLEVFQIRARRLAERNAAKQELQLSPVAQAIGVFNTVAENVVPAGPLASAGGMAAKAIGGGVSFGSRFAGAAAANVAFGAAYDLTASPFGRIDPAEFMTNAALNGVLGGIGDAVNKSDLVKLKRLMSKTETRVSKSGPADVVRFEEASQATTAAPVVNQTDTLVDSLKKPAMEPAVPVQRVTDVKAAQEVIEEARSAIRALENTPLTQLDIMDIEASTAARLGLSNMPEGWLVRGDSAELARAALGDTTGFKGAFGSLANGGITEQFFKQAFDALVAGKTTIAGVADPVLARARSAFDQGLIKSPEDLSAFEEAQSAGAASSAAQAVPQRTISTDAPPVAAHDAEDFPVDTSGVSPVVSRDGRTYRLNFENAVDKALYLVGQDTKTSMDENLMKALREAFPGQSDEAIRQAGRTMHDMGVREVLDELPSKALPGETPTVNVPSFQKIIGKKQATALVNAVETHITKTFGKSVKQLLKSGTLKVVHHASEIPGLGKDVDPRAVAGVYMPHEGRAYLVASNLSPEDVNGVLLHEVGVHGGMKAFLGEEAFQKVLDDVMARVAAGDEAFVKAKALVDEAVADGMTKAKDVAEEVLAYVVQEAPQHTLVQKIVSAIRRAVYKLTNGKVGNLTDGDYRAIALSALSGWSKVAGKPTMGLNPLYAIKVWHGTWTRDIKEFSTKFINTGEGAQVFGWGLYFTNNRKIAEWYRETVTSNVSGGSTVKVSTNAGEPVNNVYGFLLDRTSGLATKYAEQSLVSRGDTVYENALDEVSTLIGGLRFSSLDGALDEAERLARNTTEAATKRLSQFEPGSFHHSLSAQAIKKGEAVLDIVAETRKLGLSKTIIEPKGGLYEVSLNAEDEDFLDWSKPLPSTAIKHVMEAVKDIPIEWDRLGIKKRTSPLIKGKEYDGVHSTNLFGFSEKFGLDFSASNIQEYVDTKKAAIDSVPSWTSFQKETKKAELDKFSAWLTKNAPNISENPTFVASYGYTWGDVYERLKNTDGYSTGHDRAVSMALRDAGYKGVRYPAAQSVGGNSGYNYVVFEDQTAEIKALYSRVKRITDNEKNLVVPVGVSSGPLFSLFIGEKAANRLSSGDTELKGLYQGLMKAKSQLDAGVAAEDVRQETGWFKSPGDGKWRYEVSTKDLPFFNPTQALEKANADREAAYATARAQVVADFEAKLKASGIRLKVSPKDLADKWVGLNGALDRVLEKATKNALKVEKQFGEDSPEFEAARAARRVVYNAVDEAVAQNSELARPIQQKYEQAFTAAAAFGATWLAEAYPESFQTAYRGSGGPAELKGARGSFRSKSILNDGAQLLVDTTLPWETQRSVVTHEVQHLIQTVEEFGSGGTPSSFFGNIDDLKAEIEKQRQQLEAIQKNWGDVEALTPYARQAREEQLARLEQSLRWLEEESAMGSMSPFDKYQRLSGEAEARLAQTRLDYTPEQIKAKPPQSDYDVPTGELLTRVQTGTFFSRRNPQEDTENFKKWFEGSKVVDEQGNPRVVYHGTGADFNSFNTQALGQYGKGAYFSNSPDVASGYAAAAGSPKPWGTTGNPNVIPAYLSFKNPYLIDNSTRNLLTKLPTRKQLEKQGYDSIIARDVGAYGQESFEYVAFEPTQIKSATGNSGAFDGSNPDVRFSRRNPQEDTENFKKWFGESKLVDRRGQPKVFYHGTNEDISEFSPRPAKRADPKTGKPTAGPKVQAFFFSAEPWVASRYAEIRGDFGGNANVLPVYLKMENPLNLADGVDNWKQAIVDRLKGLGFSGKGVDEFQGAVNKRDDWARAGWKMFEDPEFVEQVKAKGYDGVITPGTGIGELDYEYIVFEPTQIKSATGNVGSFDGSNPSILFSKVKEQISEMADEWDQGGFKKAGLLRANAGSEEGAVLLPKTGKVAMTHIGLKLPKTSKGIAVRVGWAPADIVGTSESNAMRVLGDLLLVNSVGKVDENGKGFLGSNVGRGSELVQETADTLRDMKVKSYMGQVQMTSNKAFAAWLSAKGIKPSIKSDFNMELATQFDRELSDAMRGVAGVSEVARKAAAEIQQTVAKFNQEVKDLATRVGASEESGSLLFKAAQIDAAKTYMSRRWSRESRLALGNEVGDEGILKIIEASLLSKTPTMEPEEASKAARQLLDTLDEVNDQFEMNLAIFEGEGTPRVLLERIDLDEAHEGVELARKDGTIGKFTVRDLFENNVDRAVGSWFNTMTGIWSLGHVSERIGVDLTSNAGLESLLKQARREGATDKEVELARAAREHILGRVTNKWMPESEMGSALRKVLTMRYGMYFAFAQLADWGNQLPRSQMRRLVDSLPGIDQLKQSMKNGEPVQGLPRDLANAIGSGYEHVAPVMKQAVEAGTAGTIYRNIGVGLHKAMTLNGFYTMMDFVRQSTINFQLYKLADFAQGSYQIADAEWKHLQAFGMDKATVDALVPLLRKHVKWDEVGVIKATDFEAMRKEAPQLTTKLEAFLYKVGQDSGSEHAGVGQVIPFMTGELGRFMFQFQNAAVVSHQRLRRDLLNFDREVAMRWLASYMASVASYYARALLVSAGDEEKREKMLDPHTVYVSAMRTTSFAGFTPNAISIASRFTPFEDPMSTATVSGRVSPNTPPLFDFLTSTQQSIKDLSSAVFNEEDILTQGEAQRALRAFNPLLAVQVPIQMMLTQMPDKNLPRSSQE